jgi:hypothetical protein
VKRSAARQRPQPDEEIVGAEVSRRSLPGVQNTYIGIIREHQMTSVELLRDAQA